MFGWLLLGALLLALADTFFLLIVAGQIGALPTVGLVILTALIGTLLVRSEGRVTLRRLQQRLQNSEAPTDELLDGVLLILGGSFLITPGLLTDLAGFLVRDTHHALSSPCGAQAMGNHSYCPQETPGWISQHPIWRNPWKHMEQH